MAVALLMAVVAITSQASLRRRKSRKRVQVRNRVRVRVQVWVRVRVRRQGRVQVPRQERGQRVRAHAIDWMLWLVGWKAATDTKNQWNPVRVGREEGTLLACLHALDIPFGVSAPFTFSRSLRAPCSVCGQKLVSMNNKQNRSIAVATILD